MSLFAKTPFLSVALEVDLALILGQLLNCGLCSRYGAMGIAFLGDTATQRRLGDKRLVVVCVMNGSLLIMKSDWEGTEEGVFAGFCSCCTL